MALTMDIGVDLLPHATYGLTYVLPALALLCIHLLFSQILTRHFLE